MLPRRVLRALVAASLVTPLALAVGPRPVARARVESSFAYPYAKVWSTTVRLLRVDLGYEITDRDEEIGFVLFEYDDAGRRHAGTIELLGGRTADPNADPVRVVVRVPSMPSWVERVVVDKLGRKLREDYGDPAPTPRPPSGGEGGERPDDPPSVDG